MDRRILPAVIASGPHPTATWRPHTNDAQARRTPFYAFGLEISPAQMTPRAGCREVPIDNQETVGCCVYEAVRGAHRIVTDDEPISVLAGYWFDRCEQGSELIDCGSNSENAIAVVCTLGVVADHVWPFDASKWAERPPLEAYASAAGRVMPATVWTQCPTLNMVEVAIRNGFPVIFGTAVDSKIFDYRPGQVLGAPNPHDIQGGHEMTIVDVDRSNPDRRVWRLRNSWGKRYGEDGYLWVDDAFLSNPSAGGFFALRKA